MDAHQLERGRIAQSHRHLGRADNVGKHHGAQTGIDLRRRRTCVAMGMADAAEKGFDGREVDSDDV